MKKHLVTTTALAGLCLGLSGCASSARMPGSHIQPIAPGNVKAHYEVANSVEAKAEMQRIRILGIDIDSGDAGKSGALAGGGGGGGFMGLFGGSGGDGGMNVPNGNPSLLRRIFGPPIMPSEAMSAAYYNAVMENEVDGIIETKAAAKVHGFSLGPIFGIGNAQSAVAGMGVKLVQDGK